MNWILYMVIPWLSFAFSSCSWVEVHNQYGLKVRFLDEGKPLGLVDVKVIDGLHAEVLTTNKDGILTIKPESEFRFSHLGGGVAMSRLEQDWCFFIKGYESVLVHYNQTMPEKSTSFDGRRVTEKNGYVIAEIISVRKE